MQQTARARQDSAASMTLVSVAVVVLGDLLASSNGTYHPQALLWLAVVSGLCLAAMFGLREPWWRWLEKRNGLILSLCVGFVFYRQALAPVEILQFPFYLVSAMAVVGSAACLVMSLRKRSHLWFGLAILCWCVTAALVLHSDHPPIDVITVHQDGARALAQGQNPIALTFPLPDVPNAERFYAPGDVVNGRIRWGYPYPPLSLLLVMPAYLLTGDYRFAMVAALAIAAWILGTHRREAQGQLAAILLIYSPITWYVLGRGWTEPLLILLLAGTVVAALRHPRLTPILFGMFVAVKQYTGIAFFAAPALLRGWNSGKLLRLAIVTAAVVAITVLPFYFWDPQAFHRTYVHGFPERRDALSFHSVLLRFGIRLPGLVLGIPAGLAAVGMYRKAPLTPSGFSFCLGVFCLLIFAFAKLAFANYYFFVIGALCVALATAEYEVGALPQPPDGG